MRRNQRGTFTRFDVAVQALVLDDEHLEGGTTTTLRPQHDERIDILQWQDGGLEHVNIDAGAVSDFDTTDEIPIERVVDPEPNLRAGIRHETQSRAAREAGGRNGELGNVDGNRSRRRCHHPIRSSSVRTRKPPDADLLNTRRFRFTSSALKARTAR